MDRLTHCVVAYEVCFERTPKLFGPAPRQAYRLLHQRGLRKELPLAWPIPPNEYKRGGVQVKACHGAVDQDQTVFYNRMELCNIQVRRDEAGSRWENLSNYGLVSTNSPPPELITQNPPVASYLVNRQRKGS